MCFMIGSRAQANYIQVCYWLEVRVGQSYTSGVSHRSETSRFEFGRILDDESRFEKKCFTIYNTVAAVRTITCRTISCCGSFSSSSQREGKLRTRGRTQRPLFFGHPNSISNPNRVTCTISICWHLGYVYS